MWPALRVCRRPYWTAGNARPLEQVVPSSADRDDLLQRLRAELKRVAMERAI